MVESVNKDQNVSDGCNVKQRNPERVLIILRRYLGASAKLDEMQKDLENRTSGRTFSSPQEADKFLENAFKQREPINAERDKCLAALKAWYEDPTIDLTLWKLQNGGL